MKRQADAHNPRFLQSDPTTKGIPKKDKRKNKRKLQRKCRRRNRQK